jgi:hypothetical protein
MNALFDDISRVIASPISRREAFKRVGGTVGGAVLASLGLGRAFPGLAATEPVTCGPNEFSCGNGSNATCCKAGLKCCKGGNVALCCAPGSTCCGPGENVKCCSPGQICCGSGSHSKCCQAGPSASTPCYNATC